MPLSLALVFHFNQHTSQYAEIANRTCYRGLLSVLRSHPSLKFNLHLSGTLLRALPWFDPDTLALVRAGLADGQFELLGSTYAQNVPYACDDWDNAQQIGLHRDVLYRLFGVRPAVFWNSERTWRQSLVPLIARGGYTTTLIEDHLLQKAGLADPIPASTKRGRHSLTAVWDDNPLRERFNYAAWFGRRTQLLSYLDQYAVRPDADQLVLAYAEDAEAMGLWGWERGYLPHATWAHLDRLLTELEDADAYALIHLSSVTPSATLKSIPDGAAQWMDRALADPALPYHEDGFEDWFDFNERSPKVRHFRKLYAVVRANLQQVGAARRDPGFPRAARGASDVFYRQAIEAFCHHQYEFGCIGVGGRSYWGWENARSSFLFSRVAELAADPKPRRWIEDINGDGSDEQLLCDGRMLAAFTAYGGRLIAWFDLVDGRQWAGNQLAVPAAPYVSGETAHPRQPERPAVWLPDSYEADLKPWKTLRAREKSPTALGYRLPEWIFKREPAELTVYPNPKPHNGTPPPLRSHLGLLNDSFSINNGEPSRPDAFVDYRFEEDDIRYIMVVKPDLIVEKRIRLMDGVVRAAYRLVNDAASSRRVRWWLTNELCPDYGTLLLNGRDALEPVAPEAGGPGVANRPGGMAVVARPSLQWKELSYQPGLLALEQRLTFDQRVAAESDVAFEVTLSVVPYNPAEPAADGREVAGE